MFPIRDHNPSGRVAYVTYALMILNIGIFLSYTLTIPDEGRLSLFFIEWGLVPRRVMAGGGVDTLFTSMFLHGGWMHLAGNMLFLFIFGDNLEDILGHARYLGFYLLSGLAAAALQIASAPYSLVPMIGASGAIAGVMGGYLLMFPRAKVDVLIIFIIFFRVLPIPAWIMLGLWFGMQLLSGFSTPGDTGGVAYWAHAGGFIAGAVLMLRPWAARGGPRFWSRTHGAPPHPEATYPTVKSRIPRVGRK
ncbi:Membrane associated serine protease, rhomboid family [Pseudorhodobacter antarcticus]|jgi:membrane associated rhomboid family serine protease|uniref:Membrane associated serine protease, rhomboid family n=1 Tax=Pseudorhodobacter antarcticus TaxID=1077947 RepID=A0A1H8CSA1_9RHOB|nr:rhomboid family intramembrane serine protease [Pseudorhodobacter antarcticus]SEM97860.1 Membrane associated serine protease, rhomboid family [Pseudorhodobacter antarcticus]